jgi:hypothetical protein
MYRLRLTLLLMCFALAPVLAQDSESEAPADQEVEEAADEETSAADEVTDEEIEELLGLDEEYTELEDDFDPTEEVRFEQSIPFPTDI